MAKTRIANILILAILLAVICFGVSRAQFNGCSPGFCNPSTATLPPVDPWTNVTANVVSGDAGSMAGTSSDGLVIVMGGRFGDDVEVTVNQGLLWTAVGQANFSMAASSSDGMTLAVAQGNTLDIVAVSTDQGLTWTPRTVTGLLNPASITMSGDGMKIAVGDRETLLGGSGLVFVSVDGGGSWVARTLTSITTSNWYNLCYSRDGSTLYGDGPSGNVVIKSTDDGATFSNVAPAGAMNFQGLACGSDGSNVAAYETSTDRIYTSVDGGTSWTNQAGTPMAFSGSGGGQLCMSDNGMTMYAVAPSADDVFKSTDGGISWVDQTTPNTGGWLWLACSANGKRAVALGSRDVWVANFP